MQARPTKTAANRSESVGTKVLAALSDAPELSLAQLRELLSVGSGGVTESQLSRALRQLVASDQVVRPRRGIYASAQAVQEAPAVIPRQRKRAAPAAKAEPAAKAAKATCTKGGTAAKAEPAARPSPPLPLWPVH